MTNARRIPAAVLAAALLFSPAGCGDDEDDAVPVDRSTSPSLSPPVETRAPTARPSPSVTTGSEEGVTVRLALVDGELVERPEPNVDVDEGQTFTLIVTSDTAEEIHVHGYDKYLEVVPGEEAELSFVADKTGSWEVEVHGSDLLLFNLRVR